jgi:hypothetical protein
MESEFISRFNGRTSALATGIVLVVLSGSSVASAQIVRDTLSTVRDPRYTFADQAFGRSLASGLFEGRWFAMRQTISPLQSGATARLTFDCTLHYFVSPTLVREVVPFDFGPFGLLRDSTVPIVLRWFNASTFNPADPLQSLVSAHSIGRIADVPVASGRDFSSRPTMLMSYDIPVPQVSVTTSFYMMFGLELEPVPGFPLNIQTLYLQRSIPRPGLVHEAPSDFVYNRGPSGFGFNAYGGNANPSLAAVRLDIAAIPAPGTAIIPAVGLVLGSLRRRR